MGAWLPFLKSELRRHQLGAAPVCCFAAGPACHSQAPVPPTQRKITRVLHVITRGRTFAPSQVPERYNDWNENEDMIGLYLDTLSRQLQQAYVGMALAADAGRQVPGLQAVAGSALHSTMQGFKHKCLPTGRAFILPKFQCFCEKLW